MESNEKRPKRPRISAPVPSVDNSSESSRFERVEYNREDNSNGENSYRQPPRPYANNQETYQPRPYNPNRQNYNRDNDGSYQPRPYNPNRQNYNRDNDGSYQPRPYNPNRQNYNRDNDGSYQPRPYNPNRQNYNRDNDGSYQPRPYNPNRQNYNRDNDGSYQPRQYNNRQNNGYNRDNNRQGGYQQRQNNGYNRDNNRQGGYQQRQNNGYNRDNNRQGGFNNRGNRQGGFNRDNHMQTHGKSFVARPKRIEYEMPIPDPNEQIRLNKFMANAGICSRREADEFIQQGLVKVNGEVVTELGTKISHNDTVEYDEKVVTLESKCYILLNKPKDCVTTADDPNGRLTVLDLVKGACDERIYPVGRLDRNTTGVLLLTNDGELASKLTHPKYIKKKIYHVWTDKDISEEDMQRIADGIELEDGPVQVDGIAYANEHDRNQAGIEIHSGRNRIVRRIFESLGYHVTKLDRVYFAGLTKKNLPRGRWRYLTQQEVNYLKMGSFE